ncbi:MAG: tRNA-dihydrouridine synthase, partial [Clostridia bacterium]
CDDVFAIELNISCPNVTGGGMAFGVDENIARSLVQAVKAVSNKPIIVKLSPNVTDIVAMAKAVEQGGADGISLINTLVGMRIDIKTGKPIISVKKGGYSGKGLFPVAVRMVFEVAQAVSIPIIGMGGISTATDVIEMMMAGASAVMVGSQNLIEPFACQKIVNDLPLLMKKLNITDINQIIGRAFKNA